MYYRYKSKKKNRRPVKLFIFLIILAIASVFGYSNREKMKFWKYSFSRLEREYQGIIQADGGDKTTEFTTLLKKLEKSYEDDPADTKTIMLLAKVNYSLGELTYGRDFANTIVDDRVPSPGNTASQYFLNSIKYFKKNLSINEEKLPDDDVLVALSKLYYYLGYYGENEIYSLLKSVRKPEFIQNNDDRRFYGYMNYIVTGDERFIKYLKTIENTSSIGKMFMAGVYFKAKQYTDAIMEYKEILNGKITENERLAVQRNLGKIYFYQSLMDEALQYLLPVFAKDNENTEIKSMIQKIYLSRGDKLNAKLYE